MEVKETIELIKPLPLCFTFTVQDPATKETLYKKPTLFTSLPSFRLETTLLYAKGLLKMDLDLQRLPNLPSPFLVLAEVYNKKDNKLLSSIPIKGLTSEKKTITYPLEISGFAPGEYSIKAFLKDGEKIIAQTNSDFLVPEKPEWLGNKLGISNQVPPPWTPVKVQGNSVSVWAKGKGKFCLYFYFYNKRQWQPQSPKGAPCAFQSFDISSEKWQECKWEATIPKVENTEGIDEGADNTSSIIRYFVTAYHLEGGTVDLL